MNQTNNTQPKLNGCRVLVIDDHKNIRVSLRLTLEGEGCHIEEAANVTEALEIIKKSPKLLFDIVLLDIRMPDGSGLDVLKVLATKGAASHTIMISGEGTTKEAYQATELGAFDYIEKPFSPERILVSVGRCVNFNEISYAKEQLEGKYRLENEILGESEKVKELIALIKRVSPTSGRVLISGESGTGKELVAKAIHQHSERKEKPFIKVNCAAIPSTLIESELFGHEKGAFTGAVKTRRGVFERADHGTLFLDEVGELEGQVQAKLLRVLQSGEYNRVGSEETLTTDVRLITATNRDLAEMSQDGTFREDLYYRLNVVALQTPPLRERGKDISILSKQFLKEMCQEHSLGTKKFGNEAMGQLVDYPWPGNIRELRNYVEKVAILSEGELIESLPDLVDKSSPSFTTHAAPTDEDTFSFSTNTVSWQDFHNNAGKAYIKYILGNAGGNVSEAARTLCLERAYLHRLMKKLGIQRDVVYKDK